MKKQRIIILQNNPKYDISSARKFGEIIYLVKEYLDPFDIDKLVNIILNNLKRIYYISNEDIICLTGTSLLLSLFLTVLGHYYNEINVLLFDAKTNEYHLRTIKFER